MAAGWSVSAELMALIPRDAVPATAPAAMHFLCVSAVRHLPEWRLQTK